MRVYLDFEKPFAELEAKIAELRALSSGEDAVAIGEELTRLEIKAARALAETYANLTPWQRTQVARHPQRPHCCDDISGLFTEFTPLAGDRRFGEDRAVTGGFARFKGAPVCVIYGIAHPPQFRHGPPGGLSQGGAADGACRQVRPAGHFARRHGRRLSRHRCGGARPARQRPSRARPMPRLPSASPMSL